MTYRDDVTAAIANKNTDGISDIIQYDAKTYVLVPNAWEGALIHDALQDYANFLACSKWDGASICQPNADAQQQAIANLSDALYMDITKITPDQWEEMNAGQYAEAAKYLDEADYQWWKRNYPYVAEGTPDWSVDFETFMELRRAYGDDLFRNSPHEAMVPKYIWDKFVEWVRTHQG